ncbi:hypothetical protein D3C72_1406960 [compost metagenome]
MAAHLRGRQRRRDDQGGKPDANTQKSHVDQKDQMRLEPQTQAETGRHETQDMAPKPLLHLADCGAHSINPAKAGFFNVFLCFDRRQVKLDSTFGDQAVAVVAEVIHRPAGPKPFKLMLAARAQGPDPIAGMALAAARLWAAAVQLGLAGRACQETHGHLLSRAEAWAHPSFDR